jgi:hypothetical protein
LKNSIETPKLTKGKYSVMLVDVNTGHVLKANGELRLGEGDVFFIFDSLAEANNFIKSKVKENLELELVLYNYKGKVVSVENRFGREEIKSKKPLWKFW